MKNINKAGSSILFIILLNTTKTTAQVHWLYDFDLARTVAMEQKKWIVVDFWATWCVPCKKMDSRLWQTAAVNPIENNFVFVKVDFDKKRKFARKLNVRSLPSVLIMDPNQGVVARKIGYINNKKYINWFKKMSDINLNDLYSAMTPIIQDRKGSIAYLKLGLAYQNLAMDPTNVMIKNPLIKYSNLQLNMILKNSKDETLLRKVELYKLLNKAIVGKTKSVLKKLNQKPLENDIPELIELRHFIKGYCYLKEGDKKALAIERQLVKDPEKLVLLQ
ncbi:thioredoxin family protein [Aquimarina sp. 433]